MLVPSQGHAASVHFQPFASAPWQLVYIERLHWTHSWLYPGGWCRLMTYIRMYIHTGAINHCCGQQNTPSGEWTIAAVSVHPPNSVVTVHFPCPTSNQKKRPFAFFMLHPPWSTWKATNTPPSTSANASTVTLRGPLHTGCSNNQCHVTVTWPGVCQEWCSPSG